MTSRTESIPISAPLSTTGRCRILRSVMTAMISLRSSSSSATTRFVVIASRSVISLKLRPLVATWQRSTSRSVKIPTGFPWSAITSALILRVCMERMASSTELSASDVTTSRPLLPSNCLTFMSPPLAPSRARGRLGPDQLRREHVRQLSDLRHDLLGHGAVDADDRHRAAPGALPAELHAGDVDAVLAHEHADPADDPRLVVVHQHQHV